MGAKCSTENICTLDMYNEIEAECEGELVDEDYDKVGGIEFINDMGFEDMEEKYNYSDIYNYDNNKKLICTLVDHGGERCPDGKITIESVCEPKKEGFKNYDSNNNNYILILILIIIIYLSFKK